MTQYPPAGSQAVPEGTVVVRRERPSYTPTILVSIFFGVFGLIPAIRHSRMARERGYTTSGYWWSFGLPMLIPTLIVVAAGLSLVFVSRTSNTSSYQPQTATGNGNTTLPPSNGIDGGSSATTPVTVQTAPGYLPLSAADFKPHESEDATPEKVVDDVQGEWVEALLTSNTYYLMWALDGYTSSPLYESDAAFISGNQGRTWNAFAITRLDSGSDPGIMEISYTLTFGLQSGANYQEKITATFRWDDQAQLWLMEGNRTPAVIPSSSPVPQ